MTTQGYHDKVTIPIVLDGVKGDTLDGTLTLSTCSNVCLLTDYPLHLDFTQPVDDGFRHAFDRAMQAVPGTSGVSADLSAWLSDGNLVVTGTTDGKWDNPEIYFDPLEGIFCPASLPLSTMAIRFGSRCPSPTNGAISPRRWKARGCRLC